MGQTMGQTMEQTEDPAEHTAHRRVVIGTDGSERALPALIFAAREAALLGAALDVVCVWHVPVTLYPHMITLDPEPFEAAAGEVLGRAAVDAHDAAPGIDIRTHLVRGDAATELTELAEGADLLVVGSRGRGGFAGLLLGSVSLRCLHLETSPVAVVPVAWSTAEPGPGTRRIVVGVDGSDASVYAMQWAYDEAVLRGASIEVVHAFEYPHIISPVGSIVTLDPIEMRRSSEALLDMMTSRLSLADADAPHVERIAAVGPAAGALVEIAQGADLLVVGARGMGALKRILLGSVSQQCAHHTPCPIVVVRAPR
jgi:nucleotide-binding universal stress UspA family protein